MTATLNRPPTRRSRPRPIETRKVPINVRPSEEEQAQLRRDRISAFVALLFVIALVAFLVWAAVTGEGPPPELWEYPYLY